MFFLLHLLKPKVVYSPKGDEILSVNGRGVQGLSHQQVVSQYISLPIY